MLTLSTIPGDARGQSRCLCTGLVHIATLKKVWKVPASIMSFSRRLGKTCDDPGGWCVTTGSVLVASGSSPVAWVGMRSCRSTSVFSQTQVRFCISFCNNFPEKPFLSSQVGLWCFSEAPRLFTTLELKMLVVLPVHLLACILSLVLKSETVAFHYKSLGPGKVPAT